MNSSARKQVTNESRWISSWIHSRGGPFENSSIITRKVRKVEVARMSSCITFTQQRVSIAIADSISIAPKVVERAFAPFTDFAMRENAN